jgi:adenosylcobinamide-phosphate synthase
MIPPEILVLLFAIIIDQIFGEPPAPLHPVVWFGKAIGALEKIKPSTPTAQLVYGALLVAGATLIGALAFVGLAALRAWSPSVYTIVGAYLLKTTFAVRELRQAALRIFFCLSMGDLDAARSYLRHLVSRDTIQLDQPLMVAATVESVAENLTDSILAPLFFYLILGVPGALFYRAVNTLDSMIGYRGEYEYVGKAAARLDDVLNFIPARLGGALIVVVSAILRSNVAQAWRIMVRDHALTESPNAGWTMSAMSGALEVQLEKVGHYRLGDPLAELAPWKILHAVNIMYLVSALAVAILLIAEVLKNGYIA